MRRGIAPSSLLDLAHKRLQRWHRHESGKLLNRRSFIAGSAACAAGALAAPARAAFNDTFISTATIGVVGPFSGDAAKLGEQIGNGVRSAINDANLIRGAMDRVYAMRTFDDQNLLANGLITAQYAVDDGSIDVAIGHLKGTITEQALQTYVNGHLPLIIPASTYDRLTTHGYGGVLRLETKDSTEGNLGGSVVMQRVKPKSSVVLYQDGDYGIDVAAGYHDRMLKEKVDSKALRFPFDKPDYPAVSKAALSGNPDIIYLAGTAHDMGPMIKQLRADGYTGPLYASQGMFDGTILEKYKDVAGELLISSSFPPLNLAPSTFHIRQNFEQKYGPMTPLAVFGYAAAQIAIAAIKRGAAADRLAAARALNYATEYDTIVGPVTFLGTGDPQDPNIYFYTIKDGKWLYVQAAHRSSFVLK
jgi:branched-chain amino acid transport system substrate-binding protein